jgi:hypothetical protein
MWRGVSCRGIYWLNRWYVGKLNIRWLFCVGSLRPACTVASIIDLQVREDYYCRLTSNVKLDGGPGPNCLLVCSAFLALEMFWKSYGWAFRCYARLVYSWRGSGGHNGIWLCVILNYSSWCWWGFSGADIGGQIRQIRRGIDVMVGTPGRVIDLIERGVLKLNEVTTPAALMIT